MPGSSCHGWQNLNSHTPCFSRRVFFNRYLFVHYPYYFPVFWIPAIPAGMTVFLFRLCVAPGRRCSCSASVFLSLPGRRFSYCASVFLPLPGRRCFCCASVFLSAGTTVFLLRLCVPAPAGMTVFLLRLCVPVPAGMTVFLLCLCVAPGRRFSYCASVFLSLKKCCHYHFQTSSSLHHK